MKKNMVMLSLMGLLSAGLCLVTAPTMARSGGSGGGGGGSIGGGSAARHGGKYNLVFDAVSPLNGYTPTCSGAYGLTTYVTTLSLDIRISNCNLPDGTPLIVTAYAKDYYNGTPWVPKVAGTVTLTSRSASLVVSELWTTPAGGLPTITSVVITAPDGTIVGNGRP